ESGQLRVLAGSHRALIWPQLRQPHCDLPEVDLPTRTGDVTLHLSCTLHMAQPPVTHERRVLYTGFGLPDGNTEAASARARLSAVREAAARDGVAAPQPQYPRLILPLRGHAARCNDMGRQLEARRCDWSASVTF